MGKTFNYDLVNKIPAAFSSLPVYQWDSFWIFEFGYVLTRYKTKHYMIVRPAKLGSFSMASNVWSFFDISHNMDTHLLCLL